MPKQVETNRDDVKQTHKITIVKDFNRKIVNVP